MSVPKTLVFEAVAILSTRYSRHEDSNIRGAWQSDDYNKNEYLLDPGEATPLVAPKNYLLVATDGLFISAAITREREGITQNFTVGIDQVMLLSDRLNSVVITNDDDLGGTPSRVRLIWA